MSAHTPGPWQVDAITSSIGTIETRDGIAIGQAFQVRPHREDIHSVERKANAQLMAAAPELLCALQNALGVCQAFATQSVTAEVCATLAEAAITKATGVKP